jgi:transglutaminase-like putative cysteine protease
MKFHVGCELHYSIAASTTLFLNVEAQESDCQLIEAEDFTVTPAVSVERYHAPGTSNIYRRMILHPGNYIVRYQAEVTLSPKMEETCDVVELAVADLPLFTLPYLYPSRYCQSDRLKHFVWREFGGSLPGYQRVADICDWIYRKVEYQAGSSHMETSAYDTFTRRAGVCRDFAHLGITFCRALGIPARFVSAYACELKPSDFHAVFEAYLSGGWYLFDATRLCPLDGLVRIGVGRDAADTAFATFYGVIEDCPKVVWIMSLEASSPPVGDAILAISTASA